MRSYVYLLANHSRTLYTGVTSDLQARIWKHRFGKVPGFTNDYNINRLVWFEESGDIRSAIAREKQIKNWRRDWKLALVQSVNPDWIDLSEDWFDSKDPESSSG